MTAIRTKARDAHRAPSPATSRCCGRKGSRLGSWPVFLTGVVCVELETDPFVRLRRFDQGVRFRRFDQGFSRGQKSVLDRAISQLVVERPDQDCGGGA